MSKTQFVEFSKNGFWAYDVALGVFLKHLIDAAESNDQARLPWLTTAISHWRTVACISDYGLALDENWSEAQRSVFVAIAEDACNRLAGRESIPVEEIVSWPLLEDSRIFPRGVTQVTTGPVIELGRAVIALVSGTLPDPQPGTVWVFGAEEGRQSLGVKLPASSC